MLQALAYALPCIGFVVFFWKAQKEKSYWDQRFIVRGTKDMTLDDMNVITKRFPDLFRQRRNDAILEGTLVIIGAICGIVSLFL
jgi:hypothetical protein